MVAGVGPYEPTNGGNGDAKETFPVPRIPKMKGEEMDLILRFRCDSCHKELMVAD